jgi:hypothetical protein
MRVENETNLHKPKYKVVNAWTWSYKQHTFAWFIVTWTWEESLLYSFMIYYVIGDKDYIEMTKFLKISKMKNS